jgi:hypothetical protein
MEDELLRTIMFFFNKNIVESLLDNCISHLHMVLDVSVMGGDHDFPTVVIFCK